MKDNFSEGSGQYATYRPGYPDALFQYLRSLVANQQAAWDCGTGNGQVAWELAQTFETVWATDISQAQISHARQAPNIHYSVQPAESTHFKNGQFDLITVAQAIHWFDFERFYAEVKRTAKAGALLAVIGYGQIKVSPEVNKLIAHFYKNIIGPYWDGERKYIDEAYATIPFPFTEIKAPALVHQLRWTEAHLIGYLNTWSAVKHFIKQKGYNPVDALQHQIAQHWGREAVKEVQFPLLLRVGKI